MINLIELQPGATLRLVGGIRATVIENMQDGQWVMVRYDEVPDDPDAVGEELLCHSQDVVEMVRRPGADAVLRFDFLPSDFHPLILVLGEASDMARLAGVLRHFARDGQDVEIGRGDLAASPSGARLTLTRDGEAGARSADGHAFRWCVDAGSAEQFADLVDSLAQPSRRSGSEVLERVAEGEIPVKVSRGEFTDDFLTTASP